MKKSIEKFLEFNGKRISVLCADGTWWVAIRPICDALGVNYNRQFQNIKEDEILKDVFANQQTHDTTGRLQNMLCIPERYIYGWLFSVRSDSQDLKTYKLKCYDILYNHFHGTMTGRMNALSQKTETELEIISLEEKLKAKLMESEEYNRIQELKKKHKSISKTLNDLDVELLAGQLSLKL